MDGRKWRSGLVGWFGRGGPLAGLQIGAGEENERNRDNDDDDDDDVREERMR